MTIIRNTPILVLILFAYFALPELGLALSKTNSFVLTLAVYSGAYLAEVFRAGLAAVTVGLREAGSGDRPARNARSATPSSSR